MEKESWPEMDDSLLASGFLIYSTHGTEEME
jgi:hypothetical protein